MTTLSNNNNNNMLVSDGGDRRDCSSSSSFVNDRRSFFESIGTSERRVVETSAPARQDQQTVSLECRVAAYAFDAVEPWQLSVAAGDIVQLAASSPSEGWIECNLVTKDHARHGERGWVPEAYLTTMRESAPCVDASNTHKPYQGTTKYKPVAKNLYKSSKKKKFSLF